MKHYLQSIFNGVVTFGSFFQLNNNFALHVQFWMCKYTWNCEYSSSSNSRILVMMMVIVHVMMVMIVIDLWIMAKVYTAVSIIY
jgi:hypothetical protein